MHSAKSSTRPLVGHLGVSPRPMHVDEHEDVRRAVAHVLVVEPRRLPGLGRHRHARLADQLPRRLVEADDGSLRVRRLGVEVEDVLHARDELGVDLRDAPHLLLPRLQLLLREPATDRLARERLVLRQPHHLAGQQLQRPARSPGGRRRARRRDEQRLLVGGELPRRARTRQFAERGLEPFLDEASLVR